MFGRATSEATFRELVKLLRQISGHWVETRHHGTAADNDWVTDHVERVEELSSRLSLADQQRAYEEAGLDFDRDLFDLGLRG